MNKNTIIGSTLVMGFVVGCKPNTNMRGDSKEPVNSSAQTTTEQIANAQAKSPKMLLARVKVSELGQQKSQVELVAINQQVTITNGQQAAQAFASGQPMQLNQGANGPQAVNSNYTLQLGVPNPATSKQQMALGDVILGSPYGTGYGPGYGSGAPGYGTPPPGYGAPGYGGGYGSILYSIGGFLSYVGAVANTGAYTIASLLTILNPYSWVGNVGIGYGGGGAYPDGGYQYYPYNQSPGGPVVGGQYPGYPQQQNPGYPQQQYPGYPQQQYPQQQYPGYPQPQYPTPNMPQQPNQPMPPTGQEPMPQI